MEDSVGLKLDRRRFRQLRDAYVALPCEAYDPNDRRFRRPIDFFLKNEVRFCAALGAASRHLPSGAVTIADLGTYPGTLLRLLRKLLPPERCRLIGVGLMISEEFRMAMKEDCGAEILEVNLDPGNLQLSGKPNQGRIPLADASVDFAFALEIVEHLLSPADLLREAFRILKPEGHLVVTTPNVTRIGNIFKLFVGRSTFERLLPPGYHDPSDEWRPHSREYTLEEAGQLLREAGFSPVEARQFNGRYSRYNRRSMIQYWIDAAKIPFQAVPHLRDSLLLVGRKPGA